MTIIAEFSDYTIQSIQYFIKAIETALTSRDLAGLSNNRINKINVSKEHPLVVEMGSMINPNVKADITRTSIIPAISVTPGSMAEEGVTMGVTTETFVVDDTWIDELKTILNKSLKEIQAEVGLITIDQVNKIISAYRKTDGVIRCQKNSWGWNEEINVSSWSDSPDIDILIGTLLDSIFAKMKVGISGDNSPMRNLKYRITKGLTNFNFGRVLYGTEYSLTFFNTYHNFTIYQEDRITDLTFEPTFMTPGSDETWQPE